MCHQTTCRSCGRPTWAGCGNHIEQALSGVPADERCTCREDGTTRARGGLLSRLFGG